MWPFKRKQKSSLEIAAQESLDQEPRDVGWIEFDKEAELENSRLSTAVIGSLATTGAMDALREARHQHREGDGDEADEHHSRE